MRFRAGYSILGATLVFAFFALPGCQEAGKNMARVRPPASTPQSTLASLATVPAELPLPPASSDVELLTWSPRPIVDVLLDQVQSRYDSGQQAYQAGQLDVARQDFNSAVDLLLRSGGEATRDPRLKQLFNQITDTMQNDEIAAEQKDEAAAESGDESSDQDADTGAQAPETPSTAPIEDIANMESLPATDPRLAAMAEKELITVPHDLPLTVNQLVLQYLSFFESPRGRDIVEMGLQRAGRYRAMIESTLKKEGLPQDLIYLAQAESAFKPRVVSSKGARGVWQFMPYTGEEYGLHRNYWVDERDDPIAATRAAAEHLRDLYSMFGDWYLVMAAYNSGPLNVVRAVERTGYADFWQLEKRNALPLQTKNYVPIILALTLIAKDPALYGIQVDPDPPLTYDTVHLDHPISLHLVADATGASLDDLQSLNPELIRGITPAEPGFALRVPTGTAASLQKEIAAIPSDKWTTWRLAQLDPGESLGELAGHWHVTLASLENVNVIAADDPPAPGVKLIIPAAPPRVRRVYYRVRPGDTLGSIATRFEVSVYELQRWNRIRGERAPRGRLLRIYESYYPGEVSDRTLTEVRRAEYRSPASADASKHPEVVEHRVRRGETLWSIAHSYRTSVEALKLANPFLASRELQVGDVLVVAPRR